MKRLNLKLLLLFCLTLTMVACNNNSDNNADSGALQKLVSDQADGKSQEIMAPAELEQNISSLFGSKDGEPVDVLGNDSVQSVIQRISTN